MSIQHVLSVVAVSDLARAEQFYTRLFGTPPTNNPMPNLIEWQVTDNGWVQVYTDPERAGYGAFNLAVDDLSAHRAALTERGLEPGAEQPVNKGVVLSALTDPDGNRIQLVGNFRVVY